MPIMIMVMQHNNDSKGLKKNRQMRITVNTEGKVYVSIYNIMMREVGT